MRQRGVFCFGGRIYSAVALASILLLGGPSDQGALLAAGVSSPPPKGEGGSLTGSPAPLGACPGPLTEVRLEGLALGFAGRPFLFSAEIAPPDATQPITYTWSPEPASGQGGSTATLTWPEPGTATLAVTVENCGSLVSATQVITVLTSTATLHLPLLARTWALGDRPPGPPPDLLIFDQNGGERDWDWLETQFGAVTLDRCEGAAAVRVLQEIEGPTALVAHVERNGVPVPLVPVLYYWPDAPLLPPELMGCGKDRASVLYTGPNGNAEFAMGGGSKYFPPEGGPHIIWIGGSDGDCLGGLGWLGGTNHVHLDSQWELP